MTYRRDGVVNARGKLQLRVDRHLERFQTLFVVWMGKLCLGVQDDRITELNRNLVVICVGLMAQMSALYYVRSCTWRA